jgi:PKHD-type hydroxylase
MSYRLSPPPHPPNSCTPFVVWDNAFTDQELDDFTGYCDRLELQDATIGGHEGPAPAELRLSKVAWIAPFIDGGNQWIFDKMGSIARLMNSQFYQFDLTEIAENMQFTVYNGGDNGHYEWHQDTNPMSPMPPRKLSLVLLLTETSQFEGGDLQLFTNEIQTPEQLRGRVIGFPSYMSHRVTPVTKGQRKSLVCWVGGPHFR